MKNVGTFIIILMFSSHVWSYAEDTRSPVRIEQAKEMFGQCHSDATKIKRGKFDMGALCSTQGSCRKDIIDVIWIENKSIRVAVSPQMGGSVVFFGKKGLNSGNGVACPQGDTLCQEQWISDRFSDRGRQITIDLSDQTQNDFNAVRTGPDPNNPSMQIPLPCNFFGMNPSDPTNLLTNGGCGWNPTMAGAWQGPIGWTGDQVHLPGETGGCAVAPGLSYCTPVSMLGDGGAANLDTQNLPSAQAKKVYVRSGLYMNFRRNYPPIAGDTAILRNDIWSEQWYCLKGDSFQMQVDLHHIGNDYHWDLGQGNPGAPVISEFGAFWLQGSFDNFSYIAPEGSLTTLTDAQVQAMSPIDKFVTDSPTRWFGVGRNSVSLGLYGSLEVPLGQDKISNFVGFGVAYWGAAGLHDKDYPTSEGSLLGYLNVDPMSEYFWNITTEFAARGSGPMGQKSGSETLP